MGCPDTNSRLERSTKGHRIVLGREIALGNFFGWLGNGFLALGVIGMVLGVSGQADPLWARLITIPPIGDFDSMLHRMGVHDLGIQPTPVPLASGLSDDDDELAEMFPTSDAYHSVASIRIPSIALESEVVPANLARLPQGVTWEVPSFKVGHAEGTPGAGDKGNAILFGHVESRGLGNVFLRLDEVHPGDRITLSGEAGSFDYVIEDVLRVDRSDVSVIQPTENAVATLITCTGVWLPQVQDFSQRLVVRAELA